MKKRVIAVSLLLTIVFFSGCSVISADKASARGILPFLCPTEGTTVSNDGIITMTTDVEDNRFSFVAIQRFTDEMKYIDDITNSKLGKNSGVYKHELESGNYIIVLKGNTNKKDESVNIKVHLLQGKSYVYSYNVKTLSDETIVIEDYTFGVE